jgi:hypothetical protein
MNKLNLLLLSAALYLLLGCTAGRVAFTNPDWQNKAGYAVEGRSQTILQKKPLRFAEFYTTKVKTSSKQSYVQTTYLEGRRTSRYNGVAGILREHSKSSRRFTLNNGNGQEAEVITYNQLNASTYLFGRSVEMNFDFLLRTLGMDKKTENSYYVQVYEPDEDKPWELMLDMDAIEMNPKNYAGIFALDEQHYYTIKPINRLLGKNGPSAMPVGCIGYEITNPEGDAVAAISLLGNCSVYLSDRVSNHDRFLMAALCASLLLNEPYY